MIESSISENNDGPVINGRPALTIEDIQSWCRASHMIPLGSEAAAAMACQLNHAALFVCHWAPEFAEQRKANPSMLRMRRIAHALETLRDDLPGLLDDSRVVAKDVSATEALLDSVKKHEVLIDKYFRAPGRPPDLALNVRTNIGKLLSGLCGADGLTEKAHGIFVANAMEWLLRKRPKEGAIARSRRRRS